MKKNNTITTDDLSALIEQFRVKPLPEGAVTVKMLVERTGRDRTTVHRVMIPQLEKSGWVCGHYSTNGQRVRAWVKE